MNESIPRDMTRPRLALYGPFWTVRTHQTSIADTLKALCNPVSSAQDKACGLMSLKAIGLVASTSLA